MNLIERIESGMTTAADAEVVRRVVETWKTKEWAHEQLARWSSSIDRPEWEDRLADVKLAEQAFRNALNALEAEADNDEAP